MAKKRKKLRRSKKDRVVAGVAKGMADYFEVDVILVRVVWVLLLMPGGLPGLIPYLICWIVIPSRK
ncbi:MAG: PspC domain-containing protein [Candidatus Woesebacteria bacterium]|jgi:phage shock protein PspC (stress-responsive transcriptional regulator)